MLRPRKIFHSLHEGRGGNRDLKIGAFAGGFIGAPAGGEIQIDGCLPRQNDSEICDHRAFTGRQNNGDSLIGEFLSQEATQGRGCAQ